ncbi:Nitronate monooxygenase [Corynebacterium kalinowskii]|uniref:Propionate 3-nitronate monooxygenase n=1 Tax=Corynebacterium kalinowskii TaxID=2675216 RepID=A0A6B8VBG5_9CORY|nr:nitronate monooxygenase [Corynebacterium kalinowskii]QGU02492.1 Nitronate monooxygenase [Corynebacterium kalinowskii]
MTVLAQLSAPIIAAPMAGGPSTPALVDAIASEGGFGFLAAGYLSPEKLREQMEAVTCERYGVNLFYPQAPAADLAPVAAYAEELAPVFEAHEASVPDYASADPSDAFAAKLDVMCELRPAVVSCTFGLFTVDEVDRLHECGIEVWMTVTNPADAREAAERGADVLVVQGPEAGGHRSTLTVEEEPDARPLLELLGALDVDKPVVAAGGLTNAFAVAQALEYADAVACGTAFLLADEAGTSELHRAQVARGGRTATTRAFSGRIARGIETQFMCDHADAPAVYPHVNTLMKPIRSVTSDTNYVAAWAGTQVKHAFSGSVAEIVSALCEGDREMNTKTL